MHRILRPLTLVATVALGSVAGEETSGAQTAPVLAGWTQLGQALLDKSGCASCPATFATSTRHRSFALATDSPYPVSLSGQIDVTCADGTTYNVFLRSPVRGGIFQIVPSSCVNLDAKEIKLTVSSVSLSPQDVERTIVLGVYGRVG